MGIFVFGKRITGVLAEIKLKDYPAQHEFRLVDPRQFLHLDHEFYNASRELLESQRFRFVGDIEDITYSYSNPQYKIFVRNMLSEDGSIMAGMYHLKMNFLQNMKILDLETEFSDGTFLMTSNASTAGWVSWPPQIKAEFLPGKTSFPDLFNRHQYKLSELSYSHPEKVSLKLTTIQDVIASQNRMNVIKYQFRHRAV
jgi:hypothetical protein